MPAEALEPGAVSGSRSVRADALPDVPLVHITTGDGQLDQLLGGGVVEESAVLIHGARGSGKSRLAYRIAAASECLIVHPELTRKVARDLCASTGARLGRVHLLNELAGWESEATRLHVRRVVLDSLADDEHPVTALKAARAWAQRGRRFVLCIQHTTKRGQVAGPSGLPYWADYEWKISAAANSRARLRVLKSRGSPKGSVTLELVKKPKLARSSAHLPGASLRLRENQSPVK